MRRTLSLTGIILACLAFSSCRVSFPAQSEEAYQESVSAIKNELNKEGYNLVGLRTQTGDVDDETYTFNNKNDEILEITLAVERDSDNKTKFIKNVEMKGCTTSKSIDFDHLCGYNGIVATTLRNTQKNDIKGTKISVGGTIVTFALIDLILGAVTYYLLLSARNML